MSEMSFTKKPVFITARFRSGSTMLWNIFRQLPETRAYYEPLHEQLVSYIKFPIQADSSHFFVKSYFDEYQNIPDVVSLHRSEFANHKLLLEMDDTYPQLSNYIQALVVSASVEFLPILQFNRIDFRLPWIKKNFPNTRILHLYRNPRDQWYSTIQGFTSDIDQLLDFDHYSLATWARDLYKYFPFLAAPQIEHAYQRFYYIWKLSYLAGQRLSGLSIAYEDVLAKPEELWATILNYSDLYSDNNLNTCLRFVVAKPDRTWNRDRSDDWFFDMEQKCEKVLDELGLNKDFAVVPLREIQNRSPKYLALLDNSENDAWVMKSYKQAIARERSVVYEANKIYEHTSIERDALQSERDALQSERDVLQSERDALQSERDALQSERDALQSERDALQSERDALQSSLNMIYQSRSWRITSPMRYLTDLGRSILKHVARLFPLRTLPKRVAIKLIRLVISWTIAFPFLSRIKDSIFDRFPTLRDNLKTAVYGSNSGQTATYNSDNEYYSNAISPQVRRIYLDLIAKIKKHQDITIK